MDNQWHTERAERPLHTTFALLANREEGGEALQHAGKDPAGQKSTHACGGAGGGGGGNEDTEQPYVIAAEACVVHQQPAESPLVGDVNTNRNPQQRASNNNSSTHEAAAEPPAAIPADGTVCSDATTAKRWKSKHSSTSSMRNTVAVMEDNWVWAEDDGGHGERASTKKTTAAKKIKSSAPRAVGEEGEDEQEGDAITLTTGSALHPLCRSVDRTRAIKKQRV